MILIINGAQDNPVQLKTFSLNYLTNECMAMLDYKADSFSDSVNYLIALHETPINSMEVYNDDKEVKLYDLHQRFTLDHFSDDCDAENDTRQVMLNLHLA